MPVEFSWTPPSSECCSSMAVLVRVPRSTSSQSVDHEYCKLRSCCCTAALLLPRCTCCSCTYMQQKDVWNQPAQARSVAPGRGWPWPRHHGQHRLELGCAWPQVARPSLFRTPCSALSAWPCLPCQSTRLLPLCLFAVATPGPTGAEAGRMGLTRAAHTRACTGNGGMYCSYFLLGYSSIILSHSTFCICYASARNSTEAKGIHPRV